jgi:hypothetical protein
MAVSDFYQQQVTMYMMRREQRRRAQQAGAGDEHSQPAPQRGFLARLRRPAIESEPQPERSPRPRRRQAGLAESG